MTLHTVESWDHCVNDTAFATKLAWGPGAYNTPTLNSGRNRCSELAGNFNQANRYFEYNLVKYTSADPTVIVGFNYDATNGKTAWFRFSGTVGTSQGEFLRINLDGINNKFDVYIGPGTTLLSSTANGTVPMNQWAHIVIRYVAAASPNGALDIWINGVSILSLSGINTLPGGGSGVGVERIHLAANNVATWGFVDDFWLINGTSGDGFTALPSDPTLLGVNAYRPAVEGAHSDWTPSSGTDNAALVNEFSVTAGTGMPNTTGYVTASVSGKTDTYTMAWKEHFATILAVQCVWYSTGLASTTIAPVCRIGGTDYLGTALALHTTGGAKYYATRFDVNPATSAAWTWGDLISAEFGYQLGGTAGSDVRLYQFLVEVFGRRRCGTMRVGSMASA